MPLSSFTAVPVSTDSIVWEDRVPGVHHQTQSGKFKLVAIHKHNAKTGDYRIQPVSPLLQPRSSGIVRSNRDEQDSSTLLPRNVIPFTADAVRFQPGVEINYPITNVTVKLSKTDVIEMMEIASAVYKEDSHQNAGSWIWQEKSSSGYYYGFIYQNQDEPSSLVVAFPGTQYLKDFLGDIMLWYDTNPLIKIITNWIWPKFNVFFAFVAKAARWAGFDYVDSSFAITAQALALHPNHSFMLTGHSLGGGMAQIAAQKNGLRAIVFSAPGTHNLSKKYKVDSSFHSTISNLADSADLVPLADLQVGYFCAYKTQFKFPSLDSHKQANILKTIQDYPLPDNCFEEKEN